MKQLNPPILGLNFYFPNLLEADAFMHLAITLLNLGATFTGDASVHHEANIRSKSFASITDNPLPEDIKLDTSNLRQILLEPNHRVIQIKMRNASGIQTETDEVITYLSISPSASQRDRHPLAIWTEGWLFEGSSSRKNSGQSQKEGRKLYNRFCTLIKELRPAYAAITIEISLECPTDLRYDPRSYAFLNFFVNEDFLGKSNLSRIEGLFQNAYIEQVDGGLYISCSKEFNPRGIQLNSEEALWHSVEVAKLLSEIVHWRYT